MSELVLLRPEIRGSVSNNPALPRIFYPFHPPAKPQHVRAKHLADLRMPTLIVQGTRNEIGTIEDVAGYELSPAINFLWLEDGDHDLKPPVGALALAGGGSP